MANLKVLKQYIYTIKTIKYIMSRKLLKILFLVCLVLISCKDKKLRLILKYYDTGKLLSKEVIIDKDSIYSYRTEYYKNGNIKNEGHFKASENDTVATGLWKHYYSDGDLKWEGYYENGEPQSFKGNKIPDYDTVYAYIKVEGGQKYVTVNKPFVFRIYVDGVYPGTYYVTFGHRQNIDLNISGNYTLSNDSDYPYAFRIDEESMKCCEEGTVNFNRNYNCDSVEIVVNLSNSYDHYILLRDDQPKKIFTFPIKRE